MANKKIKITNAVRFDYTIESFRDEEIKTIEKPAFYREYDEDGNLLLEKIYAPGGYISEKYAFKYKNGKVAEQITYLDEDEIAEHQFFEYEGDNITRIITHYAGEGYEDITVLKYDENGRLLSKITYDDDEEGEKQLIEYKENTKVVKNYNEYGEPESEEITKYDDAGKVIYRKSIDHQEETQETVVFEYDTKGNIIAEQHSTGNDESPYKTVRNYYDEKGRLAKAVTVYDNEETVLELGYDENGNEISQEEKNSNGEINHRVNRKYDSNGNVIETEVDIFNHGREMDQHYRIVYEYEYY